MDASLTRKRTVTPAAQLTMPGMPNVTSAAPVVSCYGVEPGEAVLYVGKITGGPRHGAHGIVKKALRQRAVVDMGRHGTWNIPYFFLSRAQAA